MFGFHWYFLAVGAPLPETLIGAAPEPYLEQVMGRWAGRVAGTVKLVAAPGGPRASLDLTAENARLPGSTITLTTAHVTEAASPITQTIHTTTPMRPRIVSTSGVE